MTLGRMIFGQGPDTSFTVKRTLKLKDGNLSLKVRISFEDMGGLVNDRVQDVVNSWLIQAELAGYPISAFGNLAAPLTEAIKRQHPKIYNLQVAVVDSNVVSAEERNRPSLLGQLLLAGLQGLAESKKEARQERERVTATEETNRLTRQYIAEKIHSANSMRLFKKEMATRFGLYDPINSEDEIDPIEAQFREQLRTILTEGERRFEGT